MFDSSAGKVTELSGWWWWYNSVKSSDEAIGELRRISQVWGRGP